MKPDAGRPLGSKGWLSQLTQQAGEHLVAAELGRRGYAAAPFAGNVPHWDLVAVDEAGHAVPVQVKAINGTTWQFSVTSYLDLDIQETGQRRLGLAKLSNPDIVCVLVNVRRAPESIEFYLLTLAELQAKIDANYRLRLPPCKVKSVHCMLTPKHIAEYKDRWKVLDESFDKVRDATSLIANRGPVRRSTIPPP